MTSLDTHSLQTNSKKPIIIHCREAFSDLFEILNKYPEINGRFLVHCFTGGVLEMQEIVKRAGFLGVGGIITYSKNTESLKEAIKLCPIENIILETDLPFLAPGKHRGKTCLPEYIQVIAEMIATLKDTTVESVVLQSAANCQKMIKNCNS